MTAKALENTTQSEKKGIGLLILLAISFGYLKATIAVAVPVIFLEKISYTYLPLVWLVPPLSLSFFIYYFREKKVFLLLFLLFLQFVHWVLLLKLDFSVINFTYAIFTVLEKSSLLFLFTDTQSLFFDTRDLRYYSHKLKIAQVGSGLIIGLLIALGIKQMGTHSLPLLNVCGLALFIYSYIRIGSLLPKATVEKDMDEMVVDKEQKMSKSPYVIALFLMIFATNFIDYFTKNLFYSVGDQYLEPTEFAVILGYLNAGFCLVSLVLTSFLYKKMILKMRLDRMLLLPIQSMTFLLILTLGSLYFNNLAITFWLLAVAFLLFTTSLSTITNQARLLFLQVFSPSNRTLVTNKIVAVVKPLSQIVASIILFVMNQIFGYIPSIQTLCLLALLLVWALLIRYLYLDYRKVLMSFFSKGVLSSTSFTTDELVVQKELKVKIEEGDSEEIISVIKLVMATNSGNEIIHDRIKYLIENLDEKVRLETYKFLQKFPQKSAFHLLTTALVVEVSSNVPSLIKALYACGKEKSIPVIINCSNSSNEEERKSAIAILIYHDATSQTKLVELYHKEIFETDKQSRKQFLDIILEAGVPVYESLITPLLSDEDPEIRTKAIKLVGKLDYTGVIPALIKNISSKKYRADAKFSIETIGPTARPYLLKAYKEYHHQEKVSQDILLLLATMANSEVIDLIQEIYPKLESYFRTKLLKSLSILEERSEQKIFSYLCEFELRAMMHTLCTLHDLDKGRKYRFLYEAICFERDQEYFRIISIFSYLYPHKISRETAGSFVEDPNKRSAIIELLDNILDSNIKEKAIPIIEARDIENLVDLFGSHYDCQLMGMESRVEDILLHGGYRNNMWISVMALYDAMRNGQVESKKVIEKSLSPFKVTLKSKVESYLKDLYEGKFDELRSEGMDRIAFTATLKKTLLFSRLPERVLFDNLDSYKKIKLEANSTLFRAGEPATAFYYHVKGKLEVMLGGKVVSTIGEGEVFGEMQIFRKGIRTRTIRATEPSEIIEISAEIFDRLIKEEESVLLGLIDNISYMIKVKKEFREQDAFSTIKHLTGESRENLQTPKITRELTTFEKITFLRTIGLFYELPEETLILIARNIDEVRLPAGEKLCTEGELGTAMYILCDGEVQVNKKGEVVARLDTPQLIGEMGALTTEVRAATVIATKDTHLFKIHQNTLIGIIDRHHNILNGFIALLINRLLETSEN